jgi:hypothetical protein
MHLRHALHVPVALRARLRSQRLDVTLMREAHEPRERVDADPFGRLPLPPCVADFRDLGLVRRRRATDELMASHARLQRWDPRLARHRSRGVAVHAGDLILPCVNVVTEENRLAWPLEITGVGDDGGLITRGSGGTLLAVGDRRESEEQRYYDRS